MSGNPGGTVSEFTLSMEVAGWSQEPAGYTRTAQVCIVSFYLIHVIILDY